MLKILWRCLFLRTQCRRTGASVVLNDVTLTRQTRGDIEANWVNEQVITSHSPYSKSFWQLICTGNDNQTQPR